MRRSSILALAVLAILLLMTGCASNTVTVYTDMDRKDVEKLIKPFSDKTGIKLDLVHFNEVHDLVDAIAVPDGASYKLVMHETLYQPADLVLSGNMFAGDVLRARSALAQYEPSGADAIPPGAKNLGNWYGFGGRLWVLAYNTNLVKGDLPRSLFDLSSNVFPNGKISTITPNYCPFYIGAACAIKGKAAAVTLYQTLINRHAEFVNKPELAAKSIAEGSAWAGITTLAAVVAQKKAGAPIGWVIPDQGSGNMGAYVEFYSVCTPILGKNTINAHLLADYLLSTEAEALSVEMGLSDATLRQGTSAALVVIPLAIDLDSASVAWTQDLSELMPYFHQYSPSFISDTKGWIK